VWQESESAKTPTQISSLMEEIFRIDSLVRAMKPANADMHNTLSHLPTVVARHSNCHIEKGEICLPEFERHKFPILCLFAMQKREVPDQKSPSPNDEPMPFVT
jgi:hypothetical protein